MASATIFPVGGPLRPLRPLHPSCTRSVGILGLGPLCFLFFVFPSRPLPLTPPGRVVNGRSKTLRPGPIFLELILKNFFAPLQPRGPASAADLDMVRQCALEPYPPARPCHCTYLARYFQRLHTLGRLSHVLRLSDFMIRTFVAQRWL